MHNFYSAHIFSVCNMYVIYNQVNVLVLFDNYHIVLNCTAHFVHSPLNSYLMYIGYWTLNKSLLLLNVTLLHPHAPCCINVGGMGDVSSSSNNGKNPVPRLHTTQPTSGAAVILLHPHAPCCFLVGGIGDASFYKETDYIMITCYHRIMSSCNRMLLCNHYQGYNYCTVL